MASRKIANSALLKSLPNCFKVYYSGGHMHPASTLATECVPESCRTSGRSFSPSLNFKKTSAVSADRDPIEAGNNQMLCSPLGASNTNKISANASDGVLRRKRVFAVEPEAQMQLRGATEAEL
jgi:hypothetical protein